MTTACPADHPAFFFGQSAPNAGVLAGVESPFEAGIPDEALGAYRFGHFGLLGGGTGASDREEEIRVFLATLGSVYPFHGGCPWERGLSEDPPGCDSRRWESKIQREVFPAQWLSEDFSSEFSLEVPKSRWARRPGPRRGRRRAVDEPLVRAATAA